MCSVSGLQAGSRAGSLDFKSFVSKLHALLNALKSYKKLKWFKTKCSCSL